MSVVILGDPWFDEHELVADAVEARGREAVLWDTTEWPSESPVEYTVGGETCTAGESVALDEVTGVFTMMQSVFPPSGQRYADWYEDRPFRTVYRQLREWRSMFTALISTFELLGARTTVSPATFHWDKVRPAMLDCYHRNGVPVPPTLFTNDPDRVRAFVAEHERTVVKGVNGGTPPQVLREADLEDVPLERLAAAPVQFQRYVPGEDVRAYVLDGTVVGSFRYEYGEESFSFKRADPDAVAAEPVSLSERSREAIRTAGELAPAAFGVVDCRRPPDGSVVVLETNLPGRFAAADTAGVTDVAGALAAYLTGEEVEREAA